MSDKSRHSSSIPIVWRRSTGRRGIRSRLPQSIELPEEEVHIVQIQLWCRSHGDGLELTVSAVDRTPGGARDRWQYPSICHQRLRFAFDAASSRLSAAFELRFPNSANCNERRQVSVAPLTSVGGTSLPAVTEAYDRLDVHTVVVESSSHHDVHYFFSNLDTSTGSQQGRLLGLWRRRRSDQAPVLVAASSSSDDDASDASVMRSRRRQRPMVYQEAIHQMKCFS
jgi:hypothetical protein